MENKTKNRDTLKTYFQSGKVPTEAEFAELIDSVSNIKDDVQIKVGDKGWVIDPIKGKEPAIGFYLQNSEKNTPVWRLTVNSDKELLLQNEQAETALSVSQDMTFNLFGRLKVEGEVENIDIPADKKWHNLIIEQNQPGCRVYQIWICYKSYSSISYRMTEALVKHNNAHISSPQKHWWGWSGKVRLRWKVVEGKLCLQIRSKSTEIDNGIHCRIVEVWNYTETNRDGQ